MTRGSFKVDQLIDKDTVIADYDMPMSPVELKNTVSSLFPIIDRKNMIGEINGARFKVYVKNITYLGNPWESYKKRIQLGTNFKETFFDNKEAGMETILLGVYHYNNITLIADFDAESYANGKSNNSAAHVQTYDLQMALEEGVYTKMDRGDHKVIVFRPDCISRFLDVKFGKGPDQIKMIENIFEDFFDSIPHNWRGIMCYKAMLEANYKDRRQTEWAGFYLEFAFNNYLHQDSSRLDYVIFQADKTEAGLDLDLFYPKLNRYGDLKCHTKGDAILGNSVDSLNRALEFGPLYYVICEHTTKKDSECNYETLHYWHNYIREEKQRSHDPMRQANRMKGEVSLTDFVILEINKYNYKYLQSFQKGFANSNGVARNEKFEIQEKDIKNFIIYKKEFEQFSMAGRKNSF